MNYFYDVMASFLILLVFGLIFLGLALAALAKDIKKIGQNINVIL